MKRFPAIIASFFITVLVAAIMLAVGANALLNPNTVAIAAAPPSADQTGNGTNNAATTTDAARIQQLQQRIAEYQAREKQYKSELNQANQQLQQANAQLEQASGQVQQYQQVLIALQQMGIIQVNQRGQILLPNFREGN